MCAWRAQTGRADVLRALAAGIDRPLALAHGDREWWGYVPAEVEVVSPAQSADMGEAIAVAATVTGGTLSSPLPRAKLRMPSAWIVQAAESSDADEQGSIPSDERPLEAEDLRASVTDPVGYQDLVPWARLNPVLRRSLSRTATGGIDTHQLVEAVSRQRIPTRLPRNLHARWANDLVIALDFSARLYPYRWDQHQLARQLARQCGHTGLSLRILPDGPRGGWTPWHEHEHPDRIDALQAWVMPPAGGTLLIVGDLGLLAGDGDGLHRQWMAWGAAAQAAGVQVLALAPLGAEQLPAAVCQALPVLRWSPDSRFHRESGTAQPGTSPQALDELLALVATVHRVDPPLLRALRQQVPTAALHAGLEGALWAHPDVVAGSTCRLRPETADEHLLRHRCLPAEAQDAQYAVRSLHHRHLRPALQMGENLAWARNAANHPLAQGRREASTVFVRRLIASLAASHAVPHALRRELSEVADHLLAACSGIQDDPDQGLWDELRRTRQSGVGNILEAQPTTRIRYNIRILGDVLGLERAYQPSELPAKDAESTASTATPGATMGHVELPTGRLMVRARGTERWVFVDGREGFLSLLADIGRSPQTRIELVWRGGRLQVVPHARPAWTPGWKQGVNGISARVPTPQGSALEVPVQELIEGFGRFFTRGMPGPIEFEVGTDEYGLYAFVPVLKGKERYRYIPPTTFLMGSPEGVGRDDEHPQHRVTVTQGYWLADTPCTNDLWTAVMGGQNPSYFPHSANYAEEADLPVVQVSWDDAQAFLNRLNRLLPPGCVAALPTEAEWELACRAGKTMVYVWGDDIDADKANSGSEWMQPVKRWPPNAWGLYDMLGNVCEWCADGKRIYDKSPVVDPRGAAADHTDRVLRGFPRSQGQPAWDRPAGRLEMPPFWRSPTAGFRYLLKSRRIPANQGGDSDVA